MVTLRDKIQEVLNEEVDIIEEETTDCITEVWRIIDFIDCDDNGVVEVLVIVTRCNNN